MENETESIWQRVMNRHPVEKTWTVPACEGKGPVTMTLRLPDVTVTDAEGRSIVISPRQSGLVGSRMADVADWLAYGDEEWLGEDTREAR